MIKLSNLLKELKEDVGEFLFGDPDNWNDPSQYIAYRSQFDQQEEPDTDEESMVINLLQKWKSAKTGTHSNNKEFHKALVQIAEDPKFDDITKSQYSVMFRCSTYNIDNIIKFAKTTTAGDWKNAKMFGQRQPGVQNTSSEDRIKFDEIYLYGDFSICTKMYTYKPTSLISSWSTELGIASSFLDNVSPIIYIQSIPKLTDGDYIFTGGDSYENSFDAIASDNAGEGEILGLSKEYQVNIAIPESYVMKLIRLNVIQRTD